MELREHFPAPLAGAATRTVTWLWWAAFPQGGQGQARRNAWLAMTADAARARERIAVERALAVTTEVMVDVARG